MPTREVARNEWRSFFDTYSQLHEGWLVTMEVSGEDVPGEQIESDALPLLGISADTKGSEKNAIEITLGQGPSDELTHIVHDATRVQFMRADGGGFESIRIESADGDQTILTVRPASARELPRAAGG